MEITKLLETLKLTAGLLKQARIAEIDFAQLAEALENIGVIVDALQAKSDVADKLVALFKDELCSKARAIARLTGSSCELIERLINADTTDLSDLQRIKHDIETEFDRVFSRKLSEPTGAATGGEKTADFKS
jgi:hypothetical protein